MNPLIKVLPFSYFILASAHGSSPVILGNTSGNTRGENAVDIQAHRISANEVSSGWGAVSLGLQNTGYGSLALALGANNIVGGSASAGIGVANSAIGENIFLAGSGNSSNADYSIGIGSDNVLAGFASIAMGAFNTADSLSVAMGLGNNVDGYGFAIGVSNTIQGGSSTPSDLPSGAFGLLNVVSTGANNSYAFGRGNTVSASDAAVLGTGITNATTGSVMIGTSNASKMTILSNGNVAVSGSLSASGLPVLTSASTVGAGQLPAEAVRLDGVQTLTNKTLTAPAITGATLGGVTTLGGTGAANQTKVDGMTGNVGIGTAPGLAELSVGGRVDISGDVKMLGNAVIRIAPAGGLSMGIYDDGPRPE